MSRFEEKRVIVTGGCKGIGRAIVERFLKEGATVAATYHKSQKAADEMRSNFSNYKDKLFLYNLDICNSEQVDNIMHQMQEDLNGVDVLINNAGIIKDSLLYLMNEEDWDIVVKTNLYGPFYTSKSVLYHLLKQKSGCIINISSVSGIAGIAGQSNYCASKFGLIGLTKALAKEVAAKNIRVNAIAPGYIDTEMVSNIKIDNGKYSLGRVGTPEEIANIALFLASDEAGYITGQVIVADGGAI
jgi:3-oxoacyl-[acyl-carrier protein] reductase